jgi:hypothetical protein
MKIKSKFIGFVKKKRLIIQKIYAWYEMQILLRSETFTWNMYLYGEHQTKHTQYDYFYYGLDGLVFESR